MKKNESEVLSRRDRVLLLLFFVSWLGSWLVLYFYALTFLLCVRRTEGCIKGMVLLTTRSILSPAVAASSERFDTIKLFIILIISLKIIYDSFNTDSSIIKAYTICRGITVFAVIVVVSSFITGSYPIVSLLKAITFSVPMCAIIIGVSMIYEKYSMADYISVLYTALMLISAVLIPFDRFRIINNDFQGVFNHVNVMGSVGAIYIANILYSKYFTRYRKCKIAMILSTIVMCYLTKSRTALFTCAIIIIIYIIYRDEKNSKKLSKVLLGLVAVAAIIIILPNNLLSDILGKANEFIYKGGTNEIWSSRSEQMDQSQRKYAVDILIGAGFMTPYSSTVRSYSLVTNLKIEPGNIVWSLLGDTGLLGTLIFIITMLRIFACGDKKNRYLFVGALTLNMGEMVFFSTNNYSILIYLLIAEYIFDSTTNGASQYEY